jgi:hypothetical protein
MERETLLRQLAEVEKHLAISKLHIDRQIEIIDELERAGQSARNERSLLATFRSLLAQHKARRARLIRQLKA